jgi:hypothetical protein
MPSVFLLANLAMGLNHGTQRRRGTAKENVKKKQDGRSGIENHPYSRRVAKMH